MCVRNFSNVRFHNLKQSLKFKAFTYFPGIINLLNSSKKKSNPLSGPSEFLWQTTKVS